MFAYFLISCNNNDGPPAEMPQINSKPSTVSLNLDKGYDFNKVTGDSIRTLINSLGDIVRTGIPIELKGKTISSKDVSKAITKRVGNPLTQSSFFNQTRLPEAITIIPVIKDSLKIPYFLENLTPFALTNSISDTIPTGIPISITGKIAPCKHTMPVAALPLGKKENTSLNIKFLDIEQGMISSLINDILEDKNGNIWFATDGSGACMYNGQSLTNFTQREGLSDDYVLDIFEDSKGNLWFGTKAGACMYDGKNFIYFSEEEGLGNNWILKIFEDSNGNIWFGTQTSVIKLEFNSSNESFETPTAYQAQITHYSKNEGISGTRFKTIIEDKNGTLWFGSIGGLYKFSRNKFLYVGGEKEFGNASILSALEDRTGNLWFGLLGGAIYKFDGNNYFNYSLKTGFKNQAARSIYEDKNGNIWFGTYGAGLAYFDGKSFTFIKNTDGLSHNSVRSIMEDSQGNIWIGTNGGGANVINLNSFKHYNNNWISSTNTSYTILEDSRGNHWIGTIGGGIVKRDGIKMELYTENEGLVNRFITTTFEDRSGDLWIGTQNGISKYSEKKSNGKTIKTFTNYTQNQGLSAYWINSILEDSKGNFWIGTRSGGLCKLILNDNNDSYTITVFSEKEGFCSNYVTSIIEDKVGNIWFGTRRGLSMYNGKTFVVFTEKEGLCNNFIYSVFEDSNNNIWLGTQGGLSKLSFVNTSAFGVNNFNAEFTHFTEHEGLSNNYVLSIVEDNNQNIWATTKFGLNQLVYKRNKNLPAVQKLSENTRPYSKLSFPEIHTYGESDGVKGMDFFQNSVLLDNKNQLWWGSRKTVNTLDLNKFNISNKPPKAQLNRIDINGVFTDFNQYKQGSKEEFIFSEVSNFHNYPLNLELPFKSNHITFHFSANDWCAPHKIRYSYNLAGLNNQWSEPTPQSIADFRSLPFGTYTFKLRAFGEAQIWSDVFEYSFEVLRPWWKTHLFRIGVIFLLLSLVFYLNYKRTTALRERKNELEKKIKERTKQLEESNKELEAFSYSVSHDLRAPLRAVSGYTEMLLEDYQNILGDEGRRICGIISSSATQMGILIDDLLNLSRLGRKSIELEFLDMNTIISSVLEKNSTEKEKDALNLKIESLHRSDADSVLIRQVWLNLISNAIKYTSHETNPEIIISSKQKKGMTIYSIKDNGVGFNMKYVDKLFGVFQRLHTEREFEGNGVGLAIVQRIILKHNGKVWANAEVKKGATFYFSLPIHKIEKNNK